MKTYSKKFNAQRAARVELGNDAIEGVDYRTVNTKDGWTWEQGKKAGDVPKSEPDGVHIDNLTTDSHPAAAANAASWNAIPAIKHAGKHAAIEDAARKGELPEPPDFSAETHKRFRNKLANLVELAEAGDVEGLKAVVINPVSSSPKAMARYRYLCVVALEARR